MILSGKHGSTRIQSGGRLVRSGVFSEGADDRVGISTLGWAVSIGSNGCAEYNAQFVILTAGLLQSRQKPMGS
jgi:hypothetical protein